MKRSRIAVSAGLLALVMSAVAFAGSAAQTPATKIFDNGNTSGVQNGASAPTVFTTDKPWRVVQIWTYHYNNAKGATPGTIAIKDFTAKARFGPWRAKGSPAQGGVANGFWYVNVNVTLQPGRYQIIDSSPATWAQNGASGHRGFAMIYAYPAAAGWPPMPSALVAIETVANGCGPGNASTAPRFWDTSTYLDNQLVKNYTVNFRAACNLHDAGYNGSRVRDNLNKNQIVDFFGWDRKAVDDKFQQDLYKMCRQQIPGTAKSARSKCMGRGGGLSWGADYRYAAVVKAGEGAWVARPALTGLWVQSGLLPLRLSQNVRSVTGSWSDAPTNPQVEMEFRGTLISVDSESIVKGFAKVTQPGQVEYKPMSIRWNPEKPTAIVVSGAFAALSGTLRRSG